MKTYKISLLFLISIFILSSISCEKESTPGILEVFVKADGQRTANVTVKLYRSEAGRTADSLFMSEVTPSANFETIGAKFPNLTSQTYYMKVNFSNGLSSFEGSGQYYVPLNETTTYEIVCTKKPTGNLKVFIRKDLPSGVYMGGITVDLYTSKADQDAATNPLQSSNTSSINPNIDGAVFDYLPFARYYLRSNFVSGSNDYEGKGDLLVPINTTTSFHLVCTQI
ncbi:MAG: hypothetical protein HOD63_10220 [Bacteroidetes bacterium]|jgi:hypothetical protein|nr:hypothetical protein [Bacteroidota bacterium]MBT5527774.1 hypothetical protein [Cytophagia bacterium]MBT3422414.1 hypothetical protein [Bacteroidota bacterium]MBT3802368.1 hypothetical protein [Bacteroidota bacterium]MBT3935609.1 hypothetical protein [Bacteroidota bacterium]